MVHKTMFPTDAMYFDVKGVPVCAAKDGSCRAYDQAQPRAFDKAAAQKDGQAISEASFRVLMLQHQYKRFAA